MSKRAEEAALKAYPKSPVETETVYASYPGMFNAQYRAVFIQGYSQAEKDIRSERTEEALLMETGIAARLSVLRELAIKKGNDELANRIGEEIDYTYKQNRRGK